MLDLRLLRRPPPTVPLAGGVGVLGAPEANRLPRLPARAREERPVVLLPEEDDDDDFFWLGGSC